MTVKSKLANHNIIMAISGCVLLIVVLLFWSYRNQQIKKDENTRKQLEAEISQQITLYKNGQASTIDLSKIESFSWDRLFIFGPYTTLTGVQETLGYKWEPSIPTILGADTPFNLLVFTHNGKVARYVDYPRLLGEFSGAAEETGVGYEPHEAIFVINEYGYIIHLDK